MTGSPPSLLQGTENTRLSELTSGCPTTNTAVKQCQMRVIGGGEGIHERSEYFLGGFVPSKPCPLEVQLSGAAELQKYPSFKTGH